MNREIFLHIKNQQFHVVIPFHLYKDKYMSKPNENAFDQIPKNIERSLLLKQIIRYTEIDMSLYYILIEINCNIVIENVIITVKNTDSLTIKDSVNSEDSYTLDKSNHRFNEDDTINSIVSKIINEHEQSSISRSSKIESIPYDKSYRGRDVSNRSHVISSYRQSTKDEYIEPSIKRVVSDFKYEPLKTSPKTYISESTRNYQPSTPTHSSIKKREIVSPEDYKDRSDNIRQNKRKFVYEQIDNEHQIDTVGLYAKQDNGNIYIQDSNSIRPTSSHILFKEISYDKLMQAKYIIKGYFSINKCVLSDKSGLIIINNIDIDDFMKQIKSVMIII